MQQTWKSKDLTGQKFGMLTALYDSGKREPTNGCIMWVCKCDCGKLHIVNSNALRFGVIKSCGCVNRRKYE